MKSRSAPFGKQRAYVDAPGGFRPQVKSAFHWRGGFEASDPHATSLSGLPEPAGWAVADI